MNNAQQNAFLEECMQPINQNNIQAQAHFSQAQITYQRILIEEMGGQIDEEEVEREKEREATLIRERAQEAAREAAEQVRERQQEEAARQLRLNRSPELPPNNIDYTAENSLNSIDNVTLDECHLGYVSHIKTIPTDFKLEWTNAYSLVLSRVLRDLEQPSQIILTRSIKWLLVLHHILLRKPKRGSENDRQGTTILMMRFRQWHEGDYISLLDEWLKDREKNRTRKEPPNKSLEEKIQINEIKSNNLILEGYMQRGLRNLKNTSPSADMSDPIVQEQAKTKYKTRPEDENWEPYVVQNDQEEIDIKLLKHIMMLDKKSASGPSGFSNEFIIAMVSSQYPPNSEAYHIIQRLNTFATLYMNRKLPPWYNLIMCRSLHQGVEKEGRLREDGTIDYRFLGVGETLRRLFWRAAYKDQGKCFKEFSEPFQLAMGTKAGGQTLGMGTQALMELYPSHVFVKDDFVNHFGNASRQEGLKNVKADPNCAKFMPALDMEATLETEVFYKDKLGNICRAPWRISEGGEQGSTMALILACAAMQPHLEALDIALRPHNGSSRKGIDDGIHHGPPEVFWPLWNEYRRKCETQARSPICMQKTQIYVPDGNYNHCPLEFKKDTITLNNGEEVTGLTIWGISVSQDERYIKTKNDIKIEKMCSTIKKITQQLLPISKDVSFAVLRLSHQALAQFQNQTHSPITTKAAMKKLQKVLDDTRDNIIGLHLSEPDTYGSRDDPISDPNIVMDSLRLPTRMKGFGLRIMGKTQSDAAFIGGVVMAAKNWLPNSKPDGTITPGIYPLLETMFKYRGPQPEPDGQQTFTNFVNGDYTMGKNLKESFNRCKVAANNPQDGILHGEVESLCLDDKIQRLIVKQIEETKYKSISARMNQLPSDDRRRLSWMNRQSTTSAIFTTTPTISSQVPNNLFTGTAALLLGAVDPAILRLVGLRIGTTNNIVDLHGDSLANAILKGDRWRIAHDTLTKAIGTDMTTLQITHMREVYGMFVNYVSIQGRVEYDNSTREEKRKKTIVPDILLTGIRAEGSPLRHATPGPIMYEMKRVHGINTINRATGEITGVNQYYKIPRNYNPTEHVKGVDRREHQIPGGYELKAKKTDELLGNPGEQAALDALRELPTVRGLAVGAFGEMSQGIYNLIAGIAYEGAINKPAMFSQRSGTDNRSLISYWLKKRWSRIALISATQVKYDAMRHVGGSPQHRAAQPNNLVDQLDYFDERSRQSREREAHFHHFHM